MSGNFDAYAEALWQIACEEGQEEQIMQGLDFVALCFSEHPRFVALLSSPTLDRRERVGIVKRVFEKILPRPLLHCLCLLCERREISLVPSIARQYRERYDRERRCVEAVVRSAFSLSGTEKERVHTMLEKKTGQRCRVIFLVDDSRLCGLVIEVDGCVLDGSARGRWKRMGEELIR